MNVIALDPGAKTGYAWKSRGMWHIGTTPPSAIPEVLARAADDGVTHCAIEDCWAGVNLHTYRVLAEIILDLRMKAEAAGMQYELVHPMSWKHHMLSMSGVLPPKRPEQKRLSMLRARAEGAKVSNDNEADAVCICVYQSLNLQLSNVAK